MKIWCNNHSYKIDKNTKQKMTKNTTDCAVSMQPKVFDQILEPLEEFVRNQEQELPKHPNQKFGYYDFFRLLMYFFVSEGKSLRLFIDTLLNKGLVPETLHLRVVPYSTFGEAFERFSVNLFRDVFQYLLSTVPFKQIPELAALGTLYCIDGSLFPIINSMLWAEYTEKHQSLKLHLCFELNRMLPVEFLVTAANFNEREALMKMLVAGVTYIGDRGYMSFKVVHEIVQAQAHFVFRVKANLRFTVLKTLPINLPQTVLGLFDNVTDELISYTNDEFKHIYRLVCFSVAGDKFHILTDRRDLTTFQVIILYAYRWQIELLFRFLKRTMNGIHLIKNSQRGVTIQFYAMLIVALLELRLKQITIDLETPDKICEDNYNNSFENGADEDATATINEPTPSTNTDLYQRTRLKTETPISSGPTFIETIGKNLKKYWKIGIHWLTVLKSLLAEPFDERAIKLLNSS
jgi:hypothetical protein